MRLRLITIIALLAQILIGFQGAAPVAATPRLNTTFFNDDFEAATLGINWTTSVTAGGTAALSTNYHQSGAQSMFLDQNVAGAASASLVLAFDLSNQTDVFLDFWVRATGGSPFNTIRTVSISDNGGSTWKQISDLTGISQSFSHHVFDIASIATTNGLTLNSQFRILFFYASSGYGQASDGLVIDDLRLTQRAQEIAPFPLAQDTFEASSFQQGLYPYSTGGGIVELSTNYPHSGTQSVFLGQKVAGAGASYLVLALDLSNQTDVFLDFWTRATGGSPFNTIRTVSISDNGGSTWKQISNLTGISQNFSHPVFDITSAATVNGLTLNSQFRILFNYASSGYGQASDGLVIDDLRLTHRAQAITSFPFGPETFESGDVQQGVYPYSTGGGIAEISKDYAHGGTKSMLLGQKVAGAANATLTLTVDLTGQTDVLLDFWARATGGVPFGTSRTISISSDAGSTWKQILDLTSASQSFTHQSLNIASLASANGLALNNQFRILFNYYSSGYGQASDGLVIDDLKLIHTSLSGKVYNEAATAGNEVGGAAVEICTVSNICATATSNTDGSYGFGGLASGTYTLRAMPPASNTHMIGTLGPVTLTIGTTLTNQNILLPKATGTPSGASVTPAVGSVGGVPSIFWTTAAQLTQTGCVGGTASYQIISGGTTVRSGSMAESPLGTYSTQLAPFYPLHGSVNVAITIQCANGTQTPITFNIWIDPSGLVVDTNNKPITGSTVSLYSSDTITGTFALVPPGSAVMSPANRVNPMQSDSNGAFGWDVTAGFYKVRAEKAGCTIPGGSQAYNESAVLTIPPAVTDLRITLFCGETVRFWTFLPLVRR